MRKITKQQFLDFLEDWVMPIAFPPGASAKILEWNIKGKKFTNADKMILEWTGIELRRACNERDELKDKLKETEEMLEKLRITYEVLNTQYVNMLETKGP